MSNVSAALITSIPPSIDSRLASVVPVALRSFAANGYSVRSVNWPAEMARVRELFPDASVVPASRDNSLFPGRYGPTLGSVFDATADSRALAICNADVLMLPSNIHAMMEAHPGTFFAAHRLDVDRIGGDIVGLYRRGVDAVFFDRAAFAPLIEDAGLARFQLGAPFWDILLPVLASFHGPVRFIAPPFILHAVHPARWSNRDYGALRRLAARVAVDHAARHAGERPNARVFLKLAEPYVRPGELSPGRRAVRRVMQLFNIWLAGIEASASMPLDVTVDGMLSPAALRQLEGRLPESPTDAEAAVAASATPRFSPVRASRWVGQRLRELKRARRERAIRARLAEVEF